MSCTIDHSALPSPIGLVRTLSNTVSYIYASARVNSSSPLPATAVSSRSCQLPQLMQENFGKWIVGKEEDAPWLVPIAYATVASALQVAWDHGTAGSQNAFRVWIGTRRGHVIELMGGKVAWSVDVGATVREIALARIDNEDFVCLVRCEGRKWACIRAGSILKEWLDVDTILVVDIPSFTWNRIVVVRCASSDTVPDASGSHSGQLVWDVFPPPRVEDLDSDAAPSIRSHLATVSMSLANRIHDAHAQIRQAQSTISIKTGVLQAHRTYVRTLARACLTDPFLVIPDAAAGTVVYDSMVNVIGTERELESDAPTEATGGEDDDVLVERSEWRGAGSTEGIVRVCVKNQGRIEGDRGAALEAGDESDIADVEERWMEVGRIALSRDGDPNLISSATLLATSSNSAATTAPLRALVIELLHCLSDEDEFLSLPPPPRPSSLRDTLLDLRLRGVGGLTG
ncbi:hypothetical protein BDK51DRAFT_34487 [Blyttiomyces helicus]|uniref:Uncharacterized protein n=1 Tax=Blyttiomyces helicus TaxID=388810 RepID=A0A4P9WMS0_9FUNG|nr:hypothetical protein BDK51DRAFT_34487 [Blyttiomyces helicus]|eukprot:RKO92978.1 hypothetical protein BDK51DRAFT_34487 [Blyttiomyces helicus]